MIHCAVGVNLCPLFPHFVVDVTIFFFSTAQFLPRTKSKQCKERNKDREPTADPQSLQIRRSSWPRNEAVSTLEIKKARESRVSSLSTGSVKKQKNPSLHFQPSVCSHRPEFNVIFHLFGDFPPPPFNPARFWISAYWGASSRCASKWLRLERPRANWLQANCFFNSCCAFFFFFL